MKPAASALGGAFSEACRLRLELDRCPRWRWLRRRRLDVELAAAAGRADRARLELGAPADAPGLLEVLDQVLAEGELRQDPDVVGEPPPPALPRLGDPLPRATPPRTFPPAEVLERADAPVILDP